MAKIKKTVNKSYTLKTKTSISSDTRVSALSDAQSFLQTLEAQLNLNQSYVSLIVGLVVILIVGILVFTHLKGQTQSTLGPAQSTSTQEQNINNSNNTTPADNITKYTIKEGDTLFLIAQNYYNDGYKYTLLASANNIANPDIIIPGQVLKIPTVDNNNSSIGTGGSENQTIWGEKITGNTYTVAQRDWLSKIAGRAYGDIYQYERIAKANNISDPNDIEVGTVLKIPR